MVKKVLRVFELFIAIASGVIRHVFKRDRSVSRERESLFKLLFLLTHTLIRT